MKLTLCALEGPHASQLRKARLPAGVDMKAYDVKRALVYEPLPEAPWTVLLPRHLLTREGIDTLRLVDEGGDALVSYLDAAGATRTLVLEIRRGKFALMRDSGAVIAAGRLKANRRGSVSFESKSRRHLGVVGTLRPDGRLELKGPSRRRG